MYKNIVFDLGGVVVDFNPREFLVDHFLNEKIENKLYGLSETITITDDYLIYTLESKEYNFK